MHVYFQMHHKLVYPRGCIVSHTGCICSVFSTVHFEMSPQIACIRRGIITLAAFVWLFSTVRFQMCPQIAWIRAGKVTLAAFVWLFSTVRYQMCPQIACQRRGIVTLVAFV